MLSFPRVQPSASRVRAPALNSRQSANAHRPAAASPSTSDASVSAYDRDVLIVGPGVLGSRIASEWLERYPSAVVVGQTNTERAHETLRLAGVTARTKDFPSDDPSAGRSFAYVIFCAPPSGSEDYPGELRDALKYWNGRGTFVFTSSSAVYKNEDGAECDETSEVYDLGESPRVDRLLNAEKVVLDAGGVVCRLAGLYHSQRGAHKYFIKTPRLDSRADALVNLIHYEDAAELCIAALMSHTKSTVFLGTDGVPVTREAIARLAVNSGAYDDDAAVPEFTETDGPRGRVMSNDSTRRALNWEPKYSSFESFMKQDAARDSYAPADASKRRRRKWIFPVIQWNPKLPL